MKQEGRSWSGLHSQGTRARHRWIKAEEVGGVRMGQTEGVLGDWVSGWKKEQAEALRVKKRVTKHWAQ